MHHTALRLLNKGFNAHLCDKECTQTAIPPSPPNHRPGPPPPPSGTVNARAELKGKPETQRCLSGLAQGPRFPPTRSCPILYPAAGASEPECTLTEAQDHEKSREERTANMQSKVSAILRGLVPTLQSEPLHGGVPAHTGSLWSGSQQSSFHGLQG